MTVLDDKQRLGRQDSEVTVTPVSGPDQGAQQINARYIVPELEAPGDAPPAYGEHRDQVQFSQAGFEAGAEVTDDGRVNININTKSRRLADLLAPTLASQVSVASQPALPPAYIPPSLGGQPGQTPPPQLNIVIQIVGSRGDVQPFVALGKVLKDTYGHRVRIATHPTFQPFVEENELEFFSIGGDPAELMAFMVKHPGLMPGFDAVKSGEISKRRKGIQEILLGCWRSCIEAGDGLGPPPRPHAKNEPLDLSGMAGDGSQSPFVADAIIANPPSFAHIHVAEKLGIPLHMMFTMPWSPTRAFPHPLANIRSSNADDIMTNYMSYTLVEMLTWQGLGDIINRFRTSALDLSPLSLIWAPGLLSRLKIPYTYCWSPALIPKPNDWANHIDISGFFFLNLASSYTPDPELAAFLEAGPPPVYIGFGSIVVDDPNAMTRMIFDAIHLSGVRALVSKGWGGLGADEVGVPEGVFMLGNVPHDWLFEHVSAVVHHGGAGTTAAGIKAGKPTFVVPFFGDQPFWGAMISRAKAGPDPVPYKELNAEKLAESIKHCLLPDTLEQAKLLGEKIREEKGIDTGGQSFHSHLKIDSMRCAIAPSRTAVWRVRRTQVRLSPIAAAVLVDRGILQYSDLKLYRSMEYNTEDQPPDPISATASAIVMDASSIGMTIADMPRELFKTRQRLRENEEVQARSRGDSIRSPASIAPTDSASVASPSLGELPGSPLSLSTAEPSRVSDELTSAVASSRSPGSRASPTQESMSVLTSPTTEAGPSSPSGRSRASTIALKQAFTRRDSSPVGVSIEAAVNTGKGVGRIVSTGVKSPMNFCLGCAKGFRNIPRLYNDDTVRPIEKVTDLSSGIKVAGREFGYGLFDGISGLVTQPYRGAEKEGAGGLLKGFGKGIGGLLTKPVAGFWGIPAYMMQGVHAEVNKYFTRSVQNHIITARIRQGQHDFNKATSEEKEDIIQRWKYLQAELKNFIQLKKKDKMPEEPVADTDSVKTADSGASRSKGRWLSARNSSFTDWKGSPKNGGKKGSMDAPAPGSTESDTKPQSSTAEDAEFEHAILASVRETSRGNAEEDALVEAAIRESVRAVREQGAFPDPAGGLPEKNASIFKDSEYNITDEEYQELIEKAIQESLGKDAGDSSPQYGSERSAFIEAFVPNSDSTSGESPQVGTDEDDEDLKRAIAASRKPPPPLPPRGASAEDDEFKLALAASKEDMDRRQGERTEEDIVMEYIKKQSLAEEELRQRASQGRSTAAQSGADDEHDEELRRAIEESLRMSGGDGAGPSGATGS